MHAMSAHPAQPFSEIVSKEALGLRLRAIRKNKGFTLKALSAQSGVALSTLSKAELGQTSLSYEKFVAPEGYNDSYDHFKNFFAAVRSRRPVVEDAVFGFRAAGAALLGNLSIDRGEVVRWDPDSMKLA